MGEMMGDKEDLDELAALVYRRSDGNAFFIQEMLHALIEQGDIYREDGRWVRRAVSEMEVPKNIRSIIGQRLSRLDESSQDILRQASVLGQEFSVDDLVALSALAASQPASTEVDVERALEQALPLGLVRQATAGTYVFNHALTQQALFGELSPLRRRRLHLAAGRALERLTERERQRRAGELAWHFLEGNDLDRAFRYSMLAGKQAEEVFANHEAEQQYRTALELARDLGEPADMGTVLERLAGVLIVSARYEEALGVLTEAASRYRDLGDREAEARAVAQMGRAHYLYGTPDEGITTLQPLIDALEKAGEGTTGLASLWAALAELYSDVGEYEKQLAAADRALELVPADGSPERARLRLGAEITRSDALLRLGQRELAMLIMEDLIPRAEAAGDLDNLARALGTAATYYAGRGQLDKDRLYLERWLAVAERRDDRGQIVLALMALNTNAFELGDWDQAAEYLDRTESVLRPLGNTSLAIWPVASAAWLSLRRGDLASAERQAHEALDLLRGAGDAAWRRNLLRVLAESALFGGDAEQASAHLERGRRESGWMRDSGFLQTLAWVRLAQGQLDEARTFAEESVSRARRRRRQPDTIAALTVYGAVSAAAGATAEGEALLREALDAAHAIPLPFEEARAGFELATLYAARGDAGAAQRHFEEARALFERLGAQLEERRAREALARLPASSAPEAH
jgi:tetratricopeptide (TPR) repeat protein